jgi:hypothetical protein
MPKNIEQSVRDFSSRLQEIKNVDGKSTMSIDEAMQWAHEMRQALDAQKK